MSKKVEIERGLRFFIEEHTYNGFDKLIIDTVKNDNEEYEIEYDDFNNLVVVEKVSNIIYAKRATMPDPYQDDCWREVEFSNGDFTHSPGDKY